MTAKRNDAAVTESKGHSESEEERRMETEEWEEWRRSVERYCPLLTDGGGATSHLQPPRKKGVKKEEEIKFCLFFSPPLLSSLLISLSFLAGCKMLGEPARDQRA